jgi:hypothetical protein
MGRPYGEGGSLRDGGGESPDQEMAESLECENRATRRLECENRATRRLQMEVSKDNRYGAIEAGG